jgi:hypothetical protein
VSALKLDELIQAAKLSNWRGPPQSLFSQPGLAQPLECMNMVFFGPVPGCSITDIHVEQGRSDRDSLFQRLPRFRDLTESAECRSKPTIWQRDSRGTSRSPLWLPRSQRRIRAGSRRSPSRIFSEADPERLKNDSVSRFKRLRSAVLRRCFAKASVRREVA